MNITDHVLMRWAQRIEEDHISSQVAFKDWKALNPEKVIQYEKDLREAFKRAEYLTEGIYDNKKQLSKFYIDKEGLLLYVVGKDGNMVTLYDIDFGMSRVRNKNILVEILGEISEKVKEQQEFEGKKDEELKELERKRKTIEMEKDELREKLGLLESDQGLINKQIENTRNQGKVLDMHIKNTYRKIIKSIEF